MAEVRALLFVAVPVWVADFVTKQLAVRHLQPPYRPRQVLDGVLRLTLTHNQQGVMGLPVGPYGRWILSGVSILLLAVLVRLLHTTPPAARLRALSLALIIGGACGNLLDRLASARGVVDFIDIGCGAWRFWTFNVADVAIDVGVALLGWTLWRVGKRASAADRGEVAA